MRRLTLGLMAAFAAGCGTNPGPTFTQVTPTKHEDRGTIDYTGWPMLTKEPVRVEPELYLDCRAAEMPQPAPKRGPHAAHTVKYFVNPESETIVKAGTNPVPIGTTIVKEKWQFKNAVAPEAYAAMIKREAGYDSDHGDWEYVYVAKDENGKQNVERGKLTSCINCHRIAKDRDYLYRTYLKK